VAKRKNNSSGGLGRLVGPKVDGQSIQRLLAPSSLLTSSQPGSEKLVKPPRSSEVRTSPLSAKSVPTGIKFGSPSNSKTSATSQSGSIWGNLLKQTVSGGGVSSAFSGGLGSIAGLGGLISGIASLFGGGGGNSTLPPLVDFQLPTSQTQTVYVSSQANSPYQGSPVLPASNSASTGQPFQYQSAQIAQAVKNALLNSSSLNDVIAEI
jgi:hypothetical protein